MLRLDPGAINKPVLVFGLGAETGESGLYPSRPAAQFGNRARWWLPVVEPMAVRLMGTGQPLLRSCYWQAGADYVRCAASPNPVLVPAGAGDEIMVRLAHFAIAPGVLW